MYLCIFYQNDFSLSVDIKISMQKANNLLMLTISTMVHKQILLQLIDVEIFVSVPEQLLFYTMQNTGEVGFVSLEGSRTPDGTIVAFSCHPTAVTYDPVNQVMFIAGIICFG